MSNAKTSENDSVQQWIVGGPESSGGFTVQVVGVPELRVTAGTRADAIEQIRAMLGEWLASGRLMSVEVSCSNPLLHFSGHLDPTDPLEREFIGELVRQRQDDREMTLREDAKECPNSSSTPTT